VVSCRVPAVGTDALGGRTSTEVEHMATESPTDDSRTDDPLEHPVTGIPLESLGAADCRLAFDEGTYQRVRDKYERAVENGYSDGFDTFAVNHCSLDWSLTVDGEPVDAPE